MVGIHLLFQIMGLFIYKEYQIFKGIFIDFETSCNLCRIEFSVRIHIEYCMKIFLAFWVQIKPCCFIKLNLGDVILQSRYFISRYYLAIHRHYTISSSV